MTEAGEEVVYDEGKSLSFDEYGNILASEFDGFDDDAKVEFTYTVTAEVGSATAFNGWGIGSVSSIDGSSKAFDIKTITQEGDNVVKTTVGELKSFLAIHDEDEVVTAKISVVRKSVIVYSVKEESATAVALPVSDASVVSTDYVSLSGQILAAPQRGVNIVRQTLSDGSVRTTKIVVK